MVQAGKDQKIIESRSWMAQALPHTSEGGDLQGSVGLASPFLSNVDTLPNNWLLRRQQEDRSSSGEAPSFCQRCCSGFDEL